MFPEFTLSNSHVTWESATVTVDAILTFCFTRLSSGFSWPCCSNQYFLNALHINTVIYGHYADVGNMANYHHFLCTIYCTVNYIEQLILLNKMVSTEWLKNSRNPLITYRKYLHPIAQHCLWQQDHMHWLYWGQSWILSVFSKNQTAHVFSSYLASAYGT